MKNLFSILPEDFFKPLTSKYRQQYADCILLMFNSFKPEISYGVSREIVVKVLTDYFETDDREMTFDETNYVEDAREKANGVIASLKNCGWLEYEQETNHQLNVVLFEYAIPVIEGLNRILKEEEAEYQGIISQIHASLQNRELYTKPYELMIKGVQENTERLVSELKKLNVSIKRHMDKQTNEMDATEILEHFFEYHQKIGSKAYLRMKTSENISYFRNAIIEKLEEILESSDVMERATMGYMEIEQSEDREEAYDNVVSILLDIKSAFYRLDEIIEEIDRKHTRYIRNAVVRAKFLLSTGNNLEGKLSRILNHLAEEWNGAELQELSQEAEEVQRIFSVYSQRYVSPESLKVMPVSKKDAKVDMLYRENGMSEEERQLRKEALRMKNRNRFSRKNVNEYVMNLLEGKEQLPVNEIPVESRRDLIRIIYISIYAGNRANNYTIKRSDKRVVLGGCELPYFDIVRRE